MLWKIVLVIAGSAVFILLSKKPIWVRILAAIVVFFILVFLRGLLTGAF